LSRRLASQFAPQRELRKLLLRASKKAPELPTAEQVLFTALRLFHDRKAVAQAAEELSLSAWGAERMLARLPKAAITLGSKYRMEQFVDVANRIHLP
jgi:hypothetical protein